MSKGKYGSYKLAVQSASTAAFAWVELWIEESEEDRIDIDVPPERLYTPWRVAMEEGALDGLRQLRSRGMQREATRILVTGFLGTNIDTTDEAVSTATSIAVARAALGSKEIPRLAKDTIYTSWELLWEPE